MPNTMNDLNDLFGNFGLSNEGQGIEDNRETFLKINSFLNNSLDLRNIAGDVHSSKNVLDMNGGDNTCYYGRDSIGLPRKSSLGCADPSVPLGRILAKSFSYSSDSSCSPQPMSSSGHSPMNNHSVFPFVDENSPPCGSAGSRSSFNYSLPNGSAIGHQGFRGSSTSNPSSPTLEDAILMGCKDTHDLNKMSDMCLADLVNKLSFGNGGNVTSSGSSPVKIPVPNTTAPCCSRPEVVMASSPVLNMMQPSQASTNHLNSLQQTNPSVLSNMHVSLVNNSPVSLPSQIPQGLSPLQLSVWRTAQMFPGLMDGSGLLGESSPTSGPLANLLNGSSDPYYIEKAARMHRNSAAVCEAKCTWSGQLKVETHENPIYSNKVFLGGVPWDVTESALKQTFQHFPNIQIEWPGKENSANPPRGYVYVIFESEKQVKALLASCSQDFNTGGNYYYRISTRRIRHKEVQVIPWVISDNNYVRPASAAYKMDFAKTVFVGALHGMLSAKGLASIMNDLFGGVVCTGIDTDKHKYPIGSGRVTFNNVQSYQKAVKAACIEIKTPKFSKKVQIDPYLSDDSICQLCGMQQGPYFCRDENCSKYYCKSCWQHTHPLDVDESHKPLMRKSKQRSN
ncbi:uncharacterized protein LOC143039406 isoform X2 [Oratosquilla oratoria]|uniref:uncharacterized protein LOC143039406 isoform X2 n=1 Tax=Oratosquilla oratoria TaxID=337810 RepID=UPI003F770CB1